MTARGELYILPAEWSDTDIVAVATTTHPLRCSPPAWYGHVGSAQSRQYLRERAEVLAAGH
jgi:hypothetical protein